MLAWLALAWALPAAAQPPPEVSVRRNGEQIVLDVRARVAARLDVVWAVMTDYDHMTDYLSALVSSRIVSRHGDHLEVAQTGEARRGFLHFRLEAVRAVELDPPHDIRSHLIRGDFKSYEFTTRLIPEADGAVTIVHHGEYVPTAWVPPVVGPAMIESEARKQYGELIAEILHRQNGTPRQPLTR